LVVPGLRADAAVQHRGRRGHDEPVHNLSVLGPEPWKVAYVEPSVRPDDSRYGQNPNRLQTHTQFQVILKPEPGNPQELYLGSLAALGIDLRAHDVRFVEDNWAQPAIGAWGLGWEVWLDGLEITQFTYFQQVGGQNLDPVPVEITYGLERILMAIQQVSHFKDLLYAPGVSYGEVFGQSEYEMSRYYLDEADVDTTRTLLDAYSHEAARMIAHELPVPAHVFVLKSSGQRRSTGGIQPREQLEVSCALDARHNRHQAFPTDECPNDSARRTVQARHQMSP
jgi:glycyl-tRNA synthetase